MKLYLHSTGSAARRLTDGRLSPEPPGDEEPDIFVYDPGEPVPSVGGASCCRSDIAPIGIYDQRSVEARPDVLVYTTSALETGYTIAGPIELDLYATTDATDTDWTAKLVDVHPDGAALNVCDGIVRARFKICSAPGPARSWKGLSVRDLAWSDRHSVQERPRNTARDIKLKLPELRREPQSRGKRARPARRRAGDLRLSGMTVNGHRIWLCRSEARGSMAARRGVASRRDDGRIRCRNRWSRGRRVDPCGAAKRRRRTPGRACGGGQRYAAESTPEDIQDEFPIAYSNPSYFWPGLTAIAAADRGESPFAQARVMGGGSSVMGMWALRGVPDDYNAWRDAGAAGWSWDDVLPFFRKLEFGSGSIRADAWRGRADPNSPAQARKLAVIRRKTG